MSTALAAVEHRVQVALAPAEAFDLFTRQIARWWPFAGHSCFDAEARDVQFEPRVGGAVTELARDGRRMPWGTLTAWSPPGGFAMRWFPGLDESLAIDVEQLAKGEGAAQASEERRTTPIVNWHWCKERSDNAGVKFRRQSRIQIPILKDRASAGPHESHQRRKIVRAVGGVDNDQSACPTGPIDRRIEGSFEVGLAAGRPHPAAGDDVRRRVPGRSAALA